MVIRKSTLLYTFIYCIFSIYLFFRFQDALVGDIIITSYDEMRYLNNSSKIIDDMKHYGLVYMIKNFYYYSDSIHFIHYFNMAFLRLLFEDSMFLWSLYQLLIYMVGVYFFCLFICLEFKFINSSKYVYIISIIMLLYPVFHYISFSLMRDISIFAFFSMALYLYKKGYIVSLLLCLLILSFYRLNMLVCFFVYVVSDILLRRSMGFYTIIKYLTLVIFLFFIVDFIAFGFVYKNLHRIFGVDWFVFLKEYAVFLLSPLPFSISDSYPDYLRLWFMLSFLFSVFLLFYCVMKTLQRRENGVSLAIFTSSLVYVFIYSTESGIGFRQASIMLPFIYIPIFICFLNDINLRLSRKGVL